MNHTILIVEDEKEIADTLCYALNSAGMNAQWVSSGADAKTALLENNFDLCVLDVGLPDCNGFELLKEIRYNARPGQNIPVIFLTARSEEIDRIIGLEIGADDYVCKPFSPREVVARVKVIIKRANLNGKAAPTTKELLDDFGGLSNPAPASQTEIPFQQNQDNFTISYAGKVLPLTRAEYELMATFVRQPGRVFSRRQLIERIWSSNHPSDDRAIDTHIKTLRAKLKTSNPHINFIVTHRGFGYSLELNGTTN
ncbi:MAG: two-component system catabolic regulation response regulator CreB [Arenicella sp.]|jgi:two-component system catabolic regulation response regulator CreB